MTGKQDEQGKRVVRAVVDGKAIRFTVDEELAFVSNRWVDGQENTRWQEREIVKTTKGNYVKRVEFITLWRGEVGELDYYVYPTLDDVIAEFDPTDDFDRELLAKLGALDEVSEEI